MAEKKVIGKVVTKASFEVDKKGLANLKKFRKQIEDINKATREAKTPKASMTSKSSPRQQIKKESDAHVKAYKTNAKKVAEKEAKIDEHIAVKVKRAETSMMGVKFADKFAGSFKKELQDLEKELKRGEISLKAYNARVDETVKKYKTASRNTRTFTQDMRSLRRTVVNLTAAYSAFSAVQGIAQTGFKVEGTEAILKAVTDSTEEFNSEMQFLKKTSKEMGLVMSEAGRDYAKFKASTDDMGLSLEETHGAFIAITKGATAFQLSTDEMAGAFKAITQMVS